MGDEFLKTIQERVTIDLLGIDDTERPEDLSIDDHELGTSLLHNYLANRSSENLDEIIKHSDIFGMALGIKYSLMIWAANRFQDLSEEEILDCELEADRLTDPRNFLTANDLDRLWSLYYGSGDTKYTNRIKQVARNPLTHVIPRSAAIWSYNSNVAQGHLIDNDWVIEAEDVKKYQDNDHSDLNEMNDGMPKECSDDCSDDSCEE